MVSGEKNKNMKCKGGYLTFIDGVFIGCPVCNWKETIVDDFGHIRCAKCGAVVGNDKKF